MTPRTAPDQLLPEVISLARAAATAIMQVYSTDFAVEHKSDASPLTAADRAAHAIIVAGLQRLTPTVPVLSEESEPAQHAFDERRRWQSHWLVDPLDGTREFIKRNGEFTVNIALIEAHRPVLGVVLAPALAMATYAGVVGHGAWRWRGAEASREAIRVRTHAPDRPVVVGSRSHGNDAMGALLDRLGPHTLEPVGSSLKFCRLAEGSADFYPRLGPTSEWDTAAGQAVIESAGGSVIGLTGEPLQYNTRATLLNPNFLAFGDVSKDWRSFL
jgi:3'(2'), 5'-bisphosphate nucleotidase